MSNFKNNHEHKQTKITSFIFIKQSFKTSELFEDNDLFSEDPNFDNFDDDTATSENLNNEHDIDNTIKQKNLNTASDQLQIMRKMMNIYFLVKHNIATYYFEDLCNLTELQIQHFEKNIISSTDILSQLRRLSLVFQADYVSVSEVTMQVNAVIESITTDFIGKADMQPTFGTILLR
ncbi:5498_t:CDS:2, partial [Racocetra fulgida]